MIICIIFYVFSCIYLMLMTSVTLWRIWCIDENGWQEVWLESPPSVCPNVNTHNVNLNSIQELKTINSEEVIIKEQFVPPGFPSTNLKFLTESVGFDNAPNTTTITDVSWPIPIISLRIYFRSEEIHRGDTMSLIISPHAAVGVITSDVTSGNTIINVSSTVTNNVLTGHFTSLDDGTNNDELGRVISVDKNAGTMTVETAPIHNYSAATPTIVKSCIYYMRDFEFSAPGDYNVGGKHVGGGYIPSQVIGRILYKNNSSVTKHFVGYIEYYY